MEKILDTYSRYAGGDPDLAVTLTARALNLDEVTIRLALNL